MTLINTKTESVRYFTTSQDEKHIAYLDGTGNVSIYSLEVRRDMLSGEESVSANVLEAFHQTVANTEIARNYSNYGFKMTWCDQDLLIPSTKASLLILSKGSEDGKWRESFLHSAEKDKRHNADINLAVISPNGQFLATADMDGVILVWKLDLMDLTQSEVVKKIVLSESKSALFDLAWSPEDSENALLVLGNTTWERVDNVVPVEEGHPVVVKGKSVKVPSSSAVIATAPTLMDQDDIDDAAFLAFGDAFDATQPQSQAQPAPSTKDVVVNDDADWMQTQPTQAETTQSVSLATSSMAAYKPSALAAAYSSSVADLQQGKKMKKLQKSSATAKDDDDEDDNMFDNEVVESTAVKKSNVKSLFKDEADESDGDDDLDMDAGSFAAGAGAMMEDEDNAEEPMSVDQLLELAGTLKSAGTTGKVKLQPPFMPSTTKPDEKNRRYLCWNHIGNITLRQDVLEDRVEIRFTNAQGGNKNEAFPDRSGITMAALGYDGAVFSTQADEEPVGLSAVERELVTSSGRGSMIYYHAFAGNAHLDGINESFRITLSDYENVQCVAVGNGFIAAATNKKFLRIYSATGMEVSVSWLKGPVVSMVAMDNYLAVVYHAANPVDESFALQVDMFDINWRQGCRGKMVLTSFPVPMGKKAELDWIGFDADAKLLVTMDNQGMVSALIRHLGWQWVPVLNTHEIRKSIDHKYWPISIRSNKLVYVLLNGENKPAVYPQPVVSTRTLRVNIATVKNGTQMNEAQKEKFHAMLWDDAKIAHIEAEYADIAAMGIVSEEMVALEEQMKAQQLTVDKSILKAFQEACQGQQLPLAMSLALRIRTTKVIEAAIKVANHFGRASVARSLDQILEHKRAIEDMQAQAQQQMNASYQTEMYDQGSSYSNRLEDEYEEQSAHNHNANALSRKASIKQQSLPQTSHHNSSKAVTPDSSSNNAVSFEEKPSKSLNPFAINKTGMTPMKRKTVADGVDDLKSSPSPKKPSLNVSHNYSIISAYLDHCMINLPSYS